MSRFRRRTRRHYLLLLIGATVLALGLTSQAATAQGSMRSSPTTWRAGIHFSAIGKFEDLFAQPWRPC